MMVKMMLIYGIKTKGCGEDVKADTSYGEDQR